jgi:hypothetical protein
MMMMMMMMMMKGLCRGSPPYTDTIIGMEPAPKYVDSFVPGGRAPPPREPSKRAR